jgi:glyoxylase-like metal-dependent hydrolase (beta-lactamase superfamily II)
VKVLITGFPAGPWATNCYVVAPSSDAECIVIDPGYESLKQIKEIVTEHKLKPIAVLITHGHIDHMWSVTPLADGYGIPAIIHEADRVLLSHPEQGVSDAGREMILQLGGKFSEPQSISTFQGDSQISLLGFTFSMLHLPGHTPGSIAYHLAEQTTLFSGDVLFESGIGRTDLPGGSSVLMQQSIQKLFNTVPDETTVLCGHGNQTTIGEERMNNPYIQDWLQHA